MLREDEGYLSVNWLESTGAASRAQQLAIVRQHLINKGMTLPATARIGVLHLQAAFAHVRIGTPTRAGLPPITNRICHTIHRIQGSTAMGMVMT